MKNVWPNHVNWKILHATKTFEKGVPYKKDVPYKSWRGEKRREKIRLNKYIDHML